MVRSAARLRVSNHEATLPSARHAPACPGHPSEMRMAGQKPGHFSSCAPQRSHTLLHYLRSHCHSADLMGEFLEIAPAHFILPISKIRMYCEGYQHGGSKKREHDVDVQASKVLNGLRELGDLLDEPETGEALDLARNARTTEQYNILRRLRKSLTQYLERDGDLFYIGLVGHFSSGKSSTINSVLNTWGTDRERETDLNPTDTTITLITSENNAKSLLGVIREGHVTIRHESVNNELLDKVVIADTPGSGDTQFVEEVARDFLPICDVILFFFSATSPLDKTDLPLLTEIHKRLRFIPIRFIVTRADEFRIDTSKPITDSNVDTVRRDRFLGDVLTRLNKLLHPTVYTEEQFILIDNKTPPYNIDKIIELKPAR